MSLAGAAQWSPGVPESRRSPGENLRLGQWEPTPQPPAVPASNPSRPSHRALPPNLTLPGSSPDSWPWLLPAHPPTLGPQCWGRLAQFPMGP